jgi:hypothetical protein
MGIHTRFVMLPYALSHLQYCDGRPGLQSQVPKGLFWIRRRRKAVAYANDPH